MNVLEAFRQFLKTGIPNAPKGSTPNKYRPHQGAAECERRRRQMAAGRIPKCQMLRGPK